MIGQVVTVDVDDHTIEELDRQAGAAASNWRQVGHGSALAPETRVSHREVEAKRSFQGRIEMDDAVMGDEKSGVVGGKRGRGGANGIPFGGVAEATAEGWPRRVLIHLVERHAGVAIKAMAEEHFVAGAHVVSDGLGCIRALTRAGTTHTSIVSARKPKQPEKIPALKWVNTLLGNRKTAIAGAHEAIR